MKLIGDLFCNLAFKLWSIVEWYHNIYTPFEEYDLESPIQKFIQSIYDIGDYFHNS